MAENRVEPTPLTGAGGLPAKAEPPGSASAIPVPSRSAFGKNCSRSPARVILSPSAMDPATGD